jgi:hypothetical protein
MLVDIGRRGSLIDEEFAVFKAVRNNGTTPGVFIRYAAGHTRHAEKSE